MTETSEDPGFGFGGKPQKSLGPHMWGVTIEQLEAMPQEGTARDLVEKHIKPATAGKGVGMALLLNEHAPLRARTMVTHAWDESFEGFVKALRDHVDRTGDQGPFWICFCAIYQNEDGAGPSIAEQLGPSVEGGPFAAVIRSLKSLPPLAAPPAPSDRRSGDSALSTPCAEGGIMVAVITATCDIYTRMWCIYEMFVATQTECPVVCTQPPVEWVRSFGSLGWDESSNPLIVMCNSAVDSSRARCGNPANPPNADETNIRAKIESLVGDTRRWTRRSRSFGFEACWHRLCAKVRTPGRMAGCAEKNCGSLPRSATVCLLSPRGCAQTQTLRTWSITPGAEGPVPRSGPS